MWRKFWPAIFLGLALFLLAITLIFSLAAKNKRLFSPLPIIPKGEITVLSVKNFKQNSNFAKSQVFSFGDELPKKTTASILRDPVFQPKTSALLADNLAKQEEEFANAAPVSLTDKIAKNLNRSKLEKIAAAVDFFGPEKAGVLLDQRTVDWHTARSVNFICSPLQQPYLLTKNTAGPLLSIDVYVENVQPDKSADFVIFFNYTPLENPGNQTEDFLAENLARELGKILYRLTHYNPKGQMDIQEMEDLVK